MGEIIAVRGLSNADFFAQHAAPGRVGLVGGTAWVDRLIARAERHLDPDHEWGRWTHAFVCQGTRVDGQVWVIESDLELHGKHTRLGVQENRIDKYHDLEAYTTLAVVDFGLSAEQQQRVVAAGLDLVAQRARYSLRELLGTAWAMKRPELRGVQNRLAREHCFFCSAFVRHVFQATGIDLLPGVEVKNTTPEDLGRSPLPFRMWTLEREVAKPFLSQVAGKLRRGIAVRRRARRITRAGSE
jgi:hypothetical protein